MNVLTQIVSFDSFELSFTLDSRQLPIVEFHQTPYHSLHSLLRAIPALYQNLDALAKSANFLAKGLEFQWIDDIASFKKEYYEQLEAEQKMGESEEIRLIDYGIFDLSSIHLPKWKDDQLVFFVKQCASGLPYQVSISSLSSHNSPLISYALLSIVSIA